MPLVSAIISTYNSEKFIEGKIVDLVQQSIKNKLEIIIVNSGSQQNEEKIIFKYLEQYPQIKYIKTDKRESIYQAWNRGIEISSGKYITNANTDDRLKTDALEILSSFLEIHHDIALVYADQYISNIPNQTFQEVFASKNKNLHLCPDFNYIHLLDRCLVFSQPMWRRSLHFEHNLWFNPDYEISGDYDFYLRLSQNHKMYHLSIPLGVFYLSIKKDNKSHNEMGKIIKERDDISSLFIENFINKKKEDSDDIYKGFKIHLLLPIPIYIILKKLSLFIRPSLIKTFFFHRVEFIYYFSIVLLLKAGENKKAKHLFKKIYKYSKSSRINDLKKEIEQTTIDRAEV